MNMQFRLAACFLTLATAMQPVHAGIYLVYGSAASAPPVAIVDDSVVIEEGVLTPRAYTWVGAPNVGAPTVSAPALPLAFIPPATGYVAGGNVSVPSVVMVAPTATSSPELSRVIQSGHAWSVYQSGNNASGLGLIYAPTYGGNLTPSAKSARGNRARAQAFRLDYYK